MHLMKVDIICHMAYTWIVIYSNNKAAFEGPLIVIDGNYNLRYLYLAGFYEGQKILCPA